MKIDPSTVEFGKGMREKLQSAVDTAKTTVGELKKPDWKGKAAELKSRIHRKNTPLKSYNQYSKLCKPCEP